MTNLATQTTYRAELLAAYEDADGNLQQASARTLGILGKLLSSPISGKRRHVIASAGARLDFSAIGDGAHNIRRWQLRQADQPVLSGGAAAAVDIPADLTPGDYFLDIEDGLTEPVPVLVTPREAYQPPFARQRKRTWLLSVQLYALASPENWGHGDFGDLLRILEICAATGCGGVGLPPLHALFEQQPEEASPYAPSSRLFLNPLYLDLSRLPGYSQILEECGETLQRDAALVDYTAVAQAKYAAIRAAYLRFSAELPAAQARDFADFRQRKGHLLRRFAAFNLLQARHGPNWRLWPRQWREPDDTRISALAHEAPEAIGVSEFAQWQCQSQLAACRDYARQKGMAIGLYLDVAVGSHPCGFDAWNDQDSFLQGVTIGAPPDALNVSGQNWGLTAFNPTALIGSGFKPFRDILAAAMEYSGAIRIDHILGLNRFYLIPEGASGQEGAYLNYPLRELLAVLAHESQQWRCLVVGEDLGTVPQGFREQLQAAGIWTYIVTLFERGADGAFRDPAEYPYNALSTFATHDLPPFAVWAEGKDLDTLHELDIPAGESMAKRLQAYSDLMHAIATHCPSARGTPFERTVALLASSGSAVLAVALEDIFGLRHQLNVPGTDREYPNWRHRTAVSWPNAKARLEQISKILRLRES